MEEKDPDGTIHRTLSRTVGFSIDIQVSSHMQTVNTAQNSRDVDGRRGQMGYIEARAGCLEDGTQA